MVIEFALPNGSMTINADEFFETQTISKIKKALKYFSLSNPTFEAVQSLKMFLRRKANEEQTKVDNRLTFSRKSEKMAEKYNKILQYISEIMPNDMAN